MLELPPAILRLKLPILLKVELIYSIVRTVRVGSEVGPLRDDMGGWLGDWLLAGHGCSFTDRAEALNPFGTL
jgi:hypothetical protein